MRGRLRLTWIELGIVVVTLGVGATVAGADLASRRLRANEASAVATLRLIADAQAQFQAARVVDVDGDGIGEFGVFRELAGAVAVRTTVDGPNWYGAVLPTSLLPAAFGRLNRHAEARQQGYRFKVFLPSAYGTGQEELAASATDTIDGTLDWSLPETTWCVYAWPVRRGRSGRRTFFLNQDGVVTSTGGRRDSNAWVDEANSGIAFRDSGFLSGITGTQAVGTVGRDGNFWRAVE